MGSNGKAEEFWVCFDTDGCLWLLDREIEIEESDDAEAARRLAEVHKKARSLLSKEEMELLGIKALA